MYALTIAGNDRIVMLVLYEIFLVFELPSPICFTSQGSTKEYWKISIGSRKKSYSNSTWNTGGLLSSSSLMQAFVYVYPYSSPFSNTEQD